MKHINTKKKKNKVGKCNSGTTPQNCLGTSQNKMKTWLARIFVASDIISFVSTLFIILNNYLPAAFTNEVDPGTDKAILTLANGTKINLSEVKNGSLLKRGGIEITKAEDGTLVYKITGSKSTAAGYNTITTPRGGQYKIILSDGTRVWLNAASSLSYPASLSSGVTVRQVRMSGEAYFEVKEDKAHPFIVSAGEQELQVLGTRFNVSAYPDERSIKTTLLEGAVRISAFLYQDGCGAGPGRSEVVLRPNQQSTRTKNSLQITEVDTEVAVAWKNDEFNFQNEPLESIMLEISRWYNVDVVYEDQKLAQKQVGAIMSRSGKLSEVLSVLEMSENVHFKVEGRKVTVTK